ncbi:MAG: hypothetical protein AB4042_16820 [Leptolyngbyaceae cyanobacterium]
MILDFGFWILELGRFGFWSWGVLELGHWGVLVLERWGNAPVLDPDPV